MMPDTRGARDSEPWAVLVFSPIAAASESPRAHGAHILTGELRIPKQRWDMALFLRTVDPGQENPS